MKTSELMATNVQSCSPDARLHDVAKVMWDANCGAVPIVDAVGHPVGILTDRDLAMTAYLRGQALHEVRVSDVMALDVKHCQTTDSVDVARKLMVEHRIKRVPVVNEMGCLAGMLTLSDLSRAAVTVSSSSERTKWAREVAETHGSRHAPKKEGTHVLEPESPRSSASEPTGTASRRRESVR